MNSDGAYQRLEAERALLGAVLLDPTVLDRVELGADAFYDPRHNRLWAAMSSVHGRREPLDPVTVEAELGSYAKALGPHGGLGFMSDLVLAVPTATNAEHYADLIRDAALTRGVRIALGGVLASQLGGEDMLAAVFEIASRFAAQQTADIGKPIGDWTRLALERLEKIAGGDTSSFGIPTGLGDLDDVLGGLMPGNVTILGGRPSMGKSSLARTIADAINAAGGGVHVFSVEDSGESYALRALADHAQMDLSRLMKGQLQHGDMRPLAQATEELGARPTWWVDDVTGVSASQIATRVRRLKRELGTKLVVVDYLQLLVEPKARDKLEEVSRAAEALARLARAEGVAVLALSQLNRDCERRPDKRPIVADLRETGVLEQIAYAIAFCYRDEVYHKGTPDAGIAEVIVAKNKNGKTGTVRLRWDGPSTAFRPLSMRQQFRTRPLHEEER